MERLILAPQSHELVINANAVEGGADVYSYSPDEASENLGSLYVVGAHSTTSDTMNYTASLIAAMARREYYLNPALPPREAFSHTLRKVNEVVDEFFRSDGVELSVGIMALAGGMVMVSKLDKFRILLARADKVTDILNNVSLFNKEQIDDRRFSSIIHGSVQDGDRLLAYIPNRGIASRERSLKTWLTKSEPEQFIDQCMTLGKQHATFAGAFLLVDIARMRQVEKKPAIQLAPVTLAWSPRQSGSAGSNSSPQADSPIPTVAPEDVEVPRIIASEFSRGLRNTPLARLVANFRLIRLDGRGKALVLGVLAVVIASVALTVRNFWFVSATQKKLDATISGVSSAFSKAQAEVATNPGDARLVMVKALSSLTGDSAKNSSRAKDLAASIVSAMDTLDHAQTASPSVVAQLDPTTDRIVLATWSSASQSLWAVTTGGSSFSAVQLGADGTVANRMLLPAGFQPALVAGWHDGVLVVDANQKKLARITGGVATSFDIPTQDTPLDMAVFDSNVYLLTNASILKITALDTKKLVTKQWLNDSAQLASQSQRIWVDSNVVTMSADGTLTTYYKGKKSSSTSTSLGPTGMWHFVPTADGNLAVTSADLMRAYVINPATGTLVKTIKIDSDQPFVTMTNGPDASFIFVTADNRIWKTQ